MISFQESRGAKTIANVMLWIDRTNPQSLLMIHISRFNGMRLALSLLIPQDGFLETYPIPGCILSVPAHLSHIPDIALSRSANAAERLGRKDSRDDQ